MRALSRRRFLQEGAAAVAALGLPGLARARGETTGLAPSTVELLGKSEFVYVSPLRSDGSESTCHGEVWYGWLGGAVVLVTARSSWKARSLTRGLDRARIWVGDHGRWKGVLGTNEDFREAPSFEARVEASDDAALLDRLMEVYRRKYPDEIERWEPRFREGFASGDRRLLRYRPVAEPA